MVDQEAVVAVADEDTLEDTVEAMVVDETEEIQLHNFALHDSISSSAF